MARHRMLLSIDDELHSIFKEFSENLGVPAATFVTNILTDLKPRFQATLEAMNLAKEGNIEALDKLVNLADAAKQEAAMLEKDMRKDQKKHTAKSKGMKK